MKKFTFSTYLTIVMLIFFCTFVGLAFEFPYKARVMPMIIGIPGIALCLLQLSIDLFRPAASPVNATHQAGADLGSEYAAPHLGEELPEFGPHTVRQELITWGFFLSFVAGLLTIGFYFSIPLLLLSYLRWQAEASWVRALSLSIGAGLLFWVTFEIVLRLPLFPGFLGRWVIQSLLA